VATTGRSPLVTRITTSADDAPPTSSQRALEGELRCHSVSETLRYLARCADWADEQERRRAAYPVTAGLRRLIPWRRRRRI
jgi:hypothetical protein